MSILFEPVGASVLAFYLLNESITLTQFIGGSIVILSIAVYLRDNRKIKQRTKHLKVG